VKREAFPILLARWLAERDACRASRTKLGMEGYAFLCAMLREQPDTARGLEHRARLGHVAAYRFVMTLHAMKEAHICGWKVVPKSPVLPIFAFGPGVDMPPPAVRPNGRPVQSVNMPERRLCPGVMAFVQLKRALETPADRTELMEVTGLHFSTITGALDVLVALNLAHISTWMDRRQGGAALMNVEWGPGENANRPRYTRRERRALHSWRRATVRPFKALLQVTQAAAGQGVAP
jgi:hypothetical protein